MSRKSTQVNREWGLDEQKRAPKSIGEWGINEQKRAPS